MPESTEPTTLIRRNGSSSQEESTGRHGFKERVPVFTKARKVHRPSLFDALDCESEIRQSKFWGVSKFVLVSLIYWMFSNLFRKYHDRDYVFDATLFTCLANPFVWCMTWWLTALLWSFNAHFATRLAFAAKRHFTTRIYRIFTELLLFVATLKVAGDPEISVISSVFCFTIGMIYLMKIHSYIETNFDLFSQSCDFDNFPVASIKEFSYFLLVPCLVYEPDFPTFIPKNRYRNIAIRCFVLCFTMLFTYVWLTEKVIPVMVQLHRMSYIEGIVRSIIPTWISSVLFFYMVFELICNILADITGFADREFYGDWWNSTTFEEFNRLWNKPVHEFLLRHVYLKLLSLNVSKFKASVATVVCSAAVHELGLRCVTKIPDYSIFFFALMNLQPVIFYLQNASGMKGTQFGNYFFWVGLVFGIAMSMTVYGCWWAAANEEANIALGWLQPLETIVQDLPRSEVVRL